VRSGYKPVARQYLEGSEGATVRKRLGSGMLGWERWVRCRLVRSIRDRENEELVARVIASSQIKEIRFPGELQFKLALVQEDDSTRSHSKFIYRSIPGLRERVADVIL
jgi:hypothetical protein